MTAGMTTRDLNAGRISLPRVGFGALLAGTLLAGAVFGAVTYAAINMASANAAAHAAAISVALPHETTAVRDARVAAGNGQLAGDVRGLPSAVAGVSAVTRTTSFPVGRDGFGFAQPAAPAPTITIRHADGRGPLE